MSWKKPSSNSTVVNHIGRLYTHDCKAALAEVRKLFTDAQFELLAVNATRHSRAGGNPCFRVSMDINLSTLDLIHLLVEFSIDGSTF
jgi:hypothetical protein